MRFRRRRSPRGLSRRELLTASGASLALASCRSRSPLERAGSPSPVGKAPTVPMLPPGKALSGEEMAVCAAACERILPADAAPGARELGVVDFIDARLALPGKRALEARRRFRRGLSQLEAWAANRAQRPFAALDASGQDETLASFGADGGDEAFAFVRQLVTLTLEGAFADPSYGGNREKAGWALMGFDAPCPNPRCH